ncbi:Golgi SNAP receptor complex member 1-like isoform X3 [Scleropages formosus]|uniref:Golgi SNAP receptor complex member 1-like isoform X3 n=1 Tax=Scleropages formosus TaxID=113540 RepID=UPI00087851A1|nr:Golgi SNAP receptor complex member 1-like isoform X3 [Scleropages formosus]
MAGGNSNYWEDLRKQARQLETELDLKLVSFSKLCTSYGASHDDHRGRGSDTTPLLSSSSQDRMLDTLGVEIEQLLAKLTSVNDRMAEYTNTPSVTSLNAAVMHTLQRHRDILQDYTHEFQKTKGNFLAVREREDLLGSLKKEIETYKSGTGVNNRRTELFLKENEHLRKPTDRRHHKHCHGNQGEHDITAGDAEVHSESGQFPGQYPLSDLKSHDSCPVLTYFRHDIKHPELIQSLPS